MIIQRINQIETSNNSQLGNSLAYYLAGAIITGVLFTVLMIFLLVKKCGDIETVSDSESTVTSPDITVSSPSLSSTDLPSYRQVSRPTNKPPSYAQATAGETPPEYHNFALPMYTPR